MAGISVPHEDAERTIMIKHVRITNFKSLGDVSLQLDPVTVLIGRSGTGKSNCVAAFRFLRDYLLRGETALSDHGGWEQVGCATAMQSPLSPPTLAFAVTFCVEGIGGDYYY